MALVVLVFNWKYYLRKGLINCLSTSVKTKLLQQLSLAPIHRSPSKGVIEKIICQLRFLKVSLSLDVL